MADKRKKSARVAAGANAEAMFSCACRGTGMLSESTMRLTGDREIVITTRYHPCPNHGDHFGASFERMMQCKELIAQAVGKVDGFESCGEWF